MMATLEGILTEDVVKKMIDEGKSFLEGQDYASAVDHFAKALGEIVPKYGEVHDVLGRVYFCYGQALLGFARDEADVVVENMVPQDHDSDNGDMEVDSANNEENGDADKNGASAPKENGDVAAKKGSENVSADKKAEEESSSDDEDPENGSGADETTDKTGDPDAENDDAVDNLQLAWEVLELAKKIFSSGNGVTDKEMLIDTLYHLGDVSIESENFETAINDLKECLTLQETITDQPRRLADIHFKLALAYSMGNHFEESITNLNRAADLLKGRMKSLGDKPKTELSDDDEKEIVEIKDLLPEIENKILDVISYKDEAHKSVIQLLKEMPLPGAASSSDMENVKKPNEDEKKEKSKDVPKKINDISHLVRRSKRSSDDTSDADATPPKKPMPPKKPTP